MGDRANVVILQGPAEPPVVLYSHWGGTQLVDNGGVERAVQAAMPRTGDPNYFTALFIRDVIDQGIPLSGVGTRLDDISDRPNRIPVVDSMTGEVKIAGTAVDSELRVDEVMKAGVA